MLRNHGSARRTAPLFAVAACTLLASCSSADDGNLLPPDGQPVALQLVSRDPHVGLAGTPAPDSVMVRVVDAAGKGVPAVLLAFSVSTGGGQVEQEVASTDGEGLARAAWVLGDAAEQSAAARVEGLPALPLHARTVVPPDAVAPMLGELHWLLASEREHLRALLPRNPQSAQYIHEKLALLATPGIGGEILQGRYAVGAMASRSGGEIPVAVVFAGEPMRAEAGTSVAYVERAAPVLEAFLETPFPATQVRIWYGFRIGNAGGGGALFMEDRTTYETRSQGRFMPYDAILIHEVAHSYVGSESLTQFLELYAYNVQRTGSADVETWTHRRDWVPGREENEGVHALLDVYLLIGPEAMARAYRAVLPLRPPYGQPLSAEAQQAFVDAVPEAARAQVAAKVARVRN